MDELYGFLSAEELAGAIAAWREMERRARLVYEASTPEPALMWILEPVNALDRAAGTKAVVEIVRDET